MRLARSLLIGIGVAIAAFVLAALALAGLGVYQSGHGGRAWTDSGAIDGSFLHLSVADTISLAIAASSALLGFALAYRKRRA